MNNLKYIRGRMGLTQVELARKINLAPQNVLSLEKNKLSGKNALKIEKELNVNAFELMGSDVLQIIPRNEEDRQILIDIINNIKL